MELYHFAFVIQAYWADLELAEARDFNNLLQVHSAGTP
jgi:hypothetical protein